MRLFLTLGVLSIASLFAGNSHGETVEVVIFATKAGIADERVLKSSAAMLATLRSWEGFISRELIKVGENRWIDIVHWANEESAKAAQTKAMKSDSCLIFFSLLEEKDQTTYHGERLLLQTHGAAHSGRKASHASE